MTDPLWWMVLIHRTLKYSFVKYILSLPSKRVGVLTGSEELKSASFSLSSCGVAALGTSSHEECNTRQPTHLFTWGLYPPLEEKQKPSFLELLSSR